jgi:hypothetical protein
LKPYTLASIHIALRPVSPKYHIKGHGERIAINKQQTNNAECVRKVFNLLFPPLDKQFNIAKYMGVRMV